MASYFRTGKRKSAGSLQKGEYISITDRRDDVYMVISVTKLGDFLVRIALAGFRNYTVKPEQMFALWERRNMKQWVYESDQ